MPDRLGQSRQDRGSRHQRDRVKPRMLRWRRAQTDVERRRFCRGAVRSDWTPRRRGRDDQESRRIKSDQISGRGPRRFQPRAGSRATDRRVMKLRPGPCPPANPTSLNPANAALCASANIQPCGNSASPTNQAQVDHVKQTARLLIANGRLCRPSGFMGAHRPRLNFYVVLALRLIVRRGGTLPMLRHELVELFLVLGVTQAIEEIPEFDLLFLEPPQGFHAVLVKGAIAAGGRTERKAAALHPIAHPLHLVLHPLHLVRPTIAVTPASHFSAPECEKEKGKADRPPDDET